MRCHYWFINSTTWTSVDCSVVFQGPARPLVTLSPLRRGSGDPCFVITRDGAIWKTSMMASGPVTARITTSARDVVDCEAWGDGAAEFADAVGALLGAADDATGFAPAEPMIAAALLSALGVRGETLTWDTAARRWIKAHLRLTKTWVSVGTKAVVSYRRPTRAGPRAEHPVAAQ